ncbi:hypothetical protein [Maledivibacter halophilus]|uniref:Uncharacterized protein n=1 Tax=Maledivibacter halophilus TaxID=36842 RepID=A0A1T5LVK1_9FIRM|nr:hypothetical protein [Maledivibacter halophilus]SKC80026.1 hypothetical protein SAMN02194393_03413 [Maledivibacter halophilus]
MKMINTNRNKLTEYIYSLYDNGFMQDYSKNHFLIRAMKGEVDIIKEYEHLLSRSFINNCTPDFSSTFLMNFSNKLRRCAGVFSEEKIIDFVKNQLSAGKKNYREPTFFEALSEINVLFYFCNFIGKIKESYYEPKQGINGGNPEARFIFQNDVIMDIEVKKANFSNSIDPLEGENGAIKPNIALNQSTKNELKQFCLENKLQLVFPRVSKLGGFIKSASSKFQIPTTNKHFNLLFINWTYTDFPECGVNEPMSIFINTENGLFNNNNALKLIKHRDGTDIFNRNDLDKISAVILYRDTLETLLSGDFRFHFKEQTFRFAINRINNEKLDFKMLSDLLGMNPCNDNIFNIWYPLDYKFKSKQSERLLNEIQTILLKESYLLSSFNNQYN